MNKLHEFMEMICGTFENIAQYTREARDGSIIHPKAKRIIGLCNDKIMNLENSFQGFFVLEESCYETEEKTTVFHHLFLFDVNEQGKIRLTSYEAPSTIDKEKLTNSNKDLQLDFKQLKISEKFTPLLYEEANGEFFGKSISFFSPVTKFTLSMRITPHKMFVNEVFENNGKRMLGYDEPIAYEKLS